MADPTLVQNAEALALEVAEEINRVREEIVAAGSIDATLDALSDVDVSTVPPTDRQALVFDFATGVWMPGSVAAGGGGGGGTGVTSVVYYDDQTSTYPARPTTDDAIIWHGPVDPGAPMLNGDTWIDTSSGDPSPGGYIVYANGAYPARADQQPVTFVGPVSPFDLGRMINGDTWINTTTTTVTNAVYLTSAEVPGRILTLVQDNTSATYLAIKAIADAAAATAKPQDVRLTKPTGHISIDEFEGTYSLAWVRVDADAAAVSRVTWAQGAGVIGFTNNGGDPSSQLHALLQPGTLAVGEAIETCATYMGNQSPQMMGLIATDGVTYGAGAQVMGAMYNASGATLMARQNTNFSVAGTDGTAVAPVPSQVLGTDAFNRIYMRLRRTSTTTWHLLVSKNGVNWLVWSVITNSLVPTQVGFFCSGWGQAGSWTGHFDYFRKVPA